MAHFLSSLGNKWSNVWKTLQKVISLNINTVSCSEFACVEQYECLDTYLQPLSLNGLSFETQLFVPFGTGDHPTASGQNLIFSPCCGCRGISQSSTLPATKMAECVYICFTDKRERERERERGGMLGFLCRWRDSFRVGWGGWKSCPKLSSWVLKNENLSSKIDVNVCSLCLCLSLGVLAFILMQAMEEVSRVFYSKPLFEQLSFLFFFYILCVCYICATPLRRIITFWADFMMIQEEEWSCGGVGTWFGTLETI